MKWHVHRLMLALLLVLVTTSDVARALGVPSVPMFRGNAAHTGEMPGPGPDGDVTVRWQVTTDTPYEFFSSPAVSGRVLYTVVDGDILALDTATGEAVWRFTGEGEFGAMVAVVDGLVFGGSSSGNFHAIDAETGAERWSFLTEVTEDHYFTAPTVSDGIVYVGHMKAPAGPDDALYALDAATGSQRWQVAMPDLSAPAVAGGVVYVSSDEALYAFDATTGLERWQFSASAHAITSPTVAGDAVYVGSRDRHLYAIDVETGQERWRMETGGEVVPSPAVSRGTVYAASDDGYLHAIEAATGSERWRFSGRGETFLYPVIAAGSVYVCGNLFEGSVTHGGVLYAIDAMSGEERWHLATATECLRSVTVAGGMVYLSNGGKDGGTLSALWSERQTPGNDEPGR